MHNEEEDFNFDSLHQLAYAYAYEIEIYLVVYGCISLVDNPVSTPVGFLIKDYYSIRIDPVLDYLTGLYM